VAPKTWLSRLPAFAIPVAFISIGIAFLVLTPFWLDDYNLRLVGLAGIYAILALSLGTLMRFTGQLSLAHGSFAAIGAYTMAVGTVDHGQDFWVMALAGVLATSLVGYLLARPLLRLSGFYLIVATLAFSELVTILARGSLSEITHGVQGLTGIRRPELFGFVITPGENLFRFSWGVVLVGVIVVEWFAHRTPIGIALRAAAEDPVGAKSFGLPAVRRQAIVFAVSAGAAAFAGILLAVASRSVDPDGFSIGLSVSAFTMIIVGGAGAALGPVLAAIGLTELPEFVDWFGTYQQSIEGIIIVAVLLLRPKGLVSFAPFRKRSRAARSQPDASPTLRLAAAVTRNPASTTRSLSLRAAGVTKSFDGLTALSDVTIEFESGRVTGIMGPNGAGKTTLLNVISGLIVADSGTIALNDDVIKRPTPEAMVRRGVVRTYQTPRIFRELSALENVSCGSYRARGARRSAGRRPRGGDDDLDRVLELTGLTELIHQSYDISNVPFGTLRLIEIARVLLTRPDFVLLDEPAAGLDPRERALLADLIDELRSEGIGVALIEHDVPFLLSVADVVGVMNFGELLRTGTPQEVRHDPVVQEIYLGGAHHGEAEVVV
jgi:branched-chain amino acid transport system permease protein